MLSLDSPRWMSLHHAYGTAERIPAYLNGLMAEPIQPEDSELWTDIWSSLCHQGTIYTATYGTVPHLVQIGSGLEVSNQVPYLSFVGAVAASMDAAELPDDLAPAYANALKRTEVMVGAVLKTKPRDEHTVVYMLQAMSALRGCKATAYLMEGFADGEFVPRCPGDLCGVEVYVTIDGMRMFASMEDPATETVTKRTEVDPPPASSPTGGASWTENNAPGHLAALAELAGRNDLAATIRLWDGTVTCPKCNDPFPLRETLLHPNDL